MQALVFNVGHPSMLAIDLTFLYESIFYSPSPPPDYHPLISASPLHSSSTEHQIIAKMQVVGTESKSSKLGTEAWGLVSALPPTWVCFYLKDSIY